MLLRVWRVKRNKQIKHLPQKQTHQTGVFRVFECCVQSWTSPGSNTPQDTNCTATCPLSRKLFKLGEPDMQDIAGEAEMNSYGSPHTAAQKQDDQHERTFSSYVRIQVVVLKTCLGRWTIGRSGERGSGISVLPARYDDDDDDDEKRHRHES